MAVYYDYLLCSIDIDAIDEANSFTHFSSSRDRVENSFASKCWSQTDTRSTTSRSRSR